MLKRLAKELTIGRTMSAPSGEINSQDGVIQRD